ncbi:hypothetical protein Vretimale_15587 [Volvox reticuliferus]|uniref:Uncharacterized protein n=1 Tax=Volvox reticuliferus TaxID=1737510 RepID=A0A8J4GRZ9_9CHLO|nr:hypothetical protein Vretimale_15587 [Volvox reticuliferus]
MADVGDAAVQLARDAYNQNNLLSGVSADGDFEEPITLFKNKIVCGQLNIVAGVGGAGKTTLATVVCTLALMGGEMGGERIPPMGMMEHETGSYKPRAIYVEGENRLDAIQTQINGMYQVAGQPRTFNPTDQIKFLAAGAKGDYFLDKEETGKGRSLLEWLGQRLKDPSVAIVVIDSLNSVVSGGTRTTNDGAAMQRILQGLFDLAKTFKVTILLLHHSNKKGQDAVFKGMRPNASMISGAAAITNIPRQVLFVTPLMSGGNPDKTWKQVITLKTNCTKATGPLYFRTCQALTSMGKSFLTGWNEYQPPGELVMTAQVQADDPCTAILRVLRNSGDAGAMWTYVERDLLADEAFTIAQSTARGARDPSASRRSS